VFSLKEADKYLRRIQMRNINVARGKLQFEQTISSDQLSWQELCPVLASNLSAITEDKLNWNKTPPAPRLPRGVIEKTSAEYLEALRRLTGHELA